MADTAINPDPLEEDNNTEQHADTTSTQASSNALPHVEAETKESSSKHYLFFYVLICMVGGLSSICIKQLILPLHVKQLDPDHFYTSFALVASAGALAGLIATPLFGAISDRTGGRLGRRRTWIIVGGISAVVGWSLMATASGIPMLLMGQMLSQVGVDTVFAVSTALIPAMTARLRGMASAINGMAPMVGGVLGLNLVARFTDTRVVAQGYLLLIGLSTLFTVLFLCILREEPLSQATTFHLGTFLVGLLEPFKERDFTCTVISRFFAFFSYTILGSFFLTYLRDGLHSAEGIAAQRLATFQLLSTGILIAASLLVGWWSQKSGTRKLFGIIGAGGMALGLVILAFATNWSWMLLAAAVFGCGFGAHAGVNVALAVRALPNTAESGKYLGMVQASIFLALIASPQIGSFLLTHFVNNFALLFLIGGAASLLAGLVLLPLREVGPSDALSSPLW